VPFRGEPDDDELSFDTDRLVVRPIHPNDAEEAYGLLTDSRLQFLDPSFVPPDAATYAEFAQRMKLRADNDDSFRLYQWSLRLRETAVFVGLISVELRQGDRLRPKDPPLEVRELEVTAYVSPDHQGLGLGSEAAASISMFIEERFGVNRRVAKIRHDNSRVQARAVAAGATKLPGMSLQGYETWVFYDRVDN